MLGITLAALHGDDLVQVHYECSEETFERVRSELDADPGTRKLGESSMTADAALYAAEVTEAVILDL